MLKLDTVYAFEICSIKSITLYYRSLMCWNLKHQLIVNSVTMEWIKTVYHKTMQMILIIYSVSLSVYIIKCFLEYFLRTTEILCTFLTLIHSKPSKNFNNYCFKILPRSWSIFCYWYYAFFPLDTFCFLHFKSIILLPRLKFFIFPQWCFSFCFFSSLSPLEQ